MKSMTKHIVSRAQLEEIFLREGLGAILETGERTAGEFNTAYQVVTKQGTFFIKIAPPASVDVLTYERDIIRTEVEMYRHYASVSALQTPKLYAYDIESRDIRYFISDYVDVEIMTKARLSKTEKQTVWYDLGRALGELHSIRGTDGFGYPQNGLHATWEAAYFSMTNQIFADAARKHVKIPKEAQIKALMQQHKDVLADVQVPAPVHFDIWMGNIFVRNGRLHAIIDLERAMWGDPLGEFLSIDLLHTPDAPQNEPLLRGYNETAKQPLVFTDREHRRMALMRLYLGLIMWVEIPYRYQKMQAAYYWKKALARWVLRSARKELQKRTPEQ